VKGKNMRLPKIISDDSDSLIKLIDIVPYEGKNVYVFLELTRIEDHHCKYICALSMACPGFFSKRILANLIRKNYGEEPDWVKTEADHAEALNEYGAHGMIDNDSGNNKRTLLENAKLWLKLFKEDPENYIEAQANRVGNTHRDLMSGRVGLYPDKIAIYD
jgi:hypothetical protein